MDPGASQSSSIVGNVPLSDLTAWPPPQAQRMVTGLQTPHGVVLLTLEYVGDGNGSYSPLVTPNGSSVPQFSTALCRDQSVVPCIGVLESSLGSLYDIGKSVIVTAHSDNDQNQPHHLRDSETPVSPSGSFMPPIPTSPPSVVTCTTPVLSPNDLEDPTANHLSLAEDQRPGNTVSSSVFLQSISVDDVMADQTSTSGAVSLALNGVDGHSNGVICTSPDSALNADFPTNSSHPVVIEANALLADESSEILMANANSELDRMEFVIENTDGIGFSYTLDSNESNVFSLRHLLEQNPLTDSDSDIGVRRDDALSSTGLSRRERSTEFECGLLDIQPSQLDGLEGNNSIKEDIVPMSSVCSLEECKISSPASMKLTQPQHRPVLAEKTFRMDNNSVNSKERAKKKPNSWNVDCSECLGGDCFRHVVQAISDKPVPSRAWASLPGAYLAVNHIFDPRTEKQVTGVFARKLIPKCTQFGPMEGVLGKIDPMDDTKLRLLIENKHGSLVSLDMSDENTSNWMRFVRAAEDCREQNVVLSQHESSLYFTTTRDIQPRQELLVWYSQTYALRRGLKLLEPTDPWTCFKCSEVFTNSVDIQRHLNVHANEQNENDDVAQLKCGHLGQPVKKKGVLHFAMIKLKHGFERNTRTQSHQCTTCKRVFPRNYSLKRHLLLHARERKHTCLKCSVKFNNSQLKDRHMRSVHNIEPMPALNDKNELDCTEKSDTWGCSYCVLVFRAPELLRLHSLVHSDETGAEIGTGNVDLEEFRVHTDLLRCPECLQDFSTARELAHHASSHGKGITRRLKRKVDPNKPFRCQRCYKSFASKERLAHHMLVHGSDESKPLQCDICAKRFLTNSALICHVKSHSGGTKRFDCPICKKTFDQGLALRDHVHVHSNNGYFTCPHCNKVFQGYGSTRKHIRAFHNERTQKCHHCNHMFPTSDKLRMHMLRHSDHREFLCANCGKQFKRKDKLKEHMTRMHSIEREAESKARARSSNRASNRRLVDQSNAHNALPGNKMPADAAADKLKKKKKSVPKQKDAQNLAMVDYERYVFKCHPCLQGFKRRGMLVNHLAKRHPDVAPDDVPELNLPILRTTRDYFCQYCEKVYKSSSKRKAHILKNHPGADLPSDGRQKSSGRTYMFSQSVGTEPTAPHHCQWCYKQYATKAKLLQHQRGMHKDLLTESLIEAKSRGKKDLQNPAVSTTSPAVKSKVNVESTVKSKVNFEFETSIVDMSDVNEFSATSGVDTSSVDALVVSSSDSAKDLKSGHNIVLEAIDQEQEGVDMNEKMLSEAMQFLAATGNLHILGNNAYPPR